MDIWVLVADRSRAQIHAWKRGEAPRIISQIDHPSGRRRDRDFNSDKPGRAFDSAAEGRHSLGWSEMPTEHHARAFARELARVLGHARTQGRFDALMLVAEPRFLGMLREELDAPTRACIVGEVPKELSAPGSGDLETQLEATRIDRH